MITADSIYGAMLGVALGDALGRPTEFMRLADIHAKYGATGHMTLPSPAHFTDDTQMTLALARAIKIVRSLTPRALVRSITHEFTRWHRTEPPRAPGVSCITAIRGLEKARRRKQSWTTGTTLSLGCGANMRVTPAALIPNADTFVGVAQLQAALTHGHPLAIAASELTGWAVRYAAQGMPLIELPHALYERALTQRGYYRVHWLGPLESRWRGTASDEMTDAWSTMAKMTMRVSALLGVRKAPRDVCAILGESWVAHEAYATGLYHAVRYASDPVLAISMAARTSGDSDSIAAIAGGIAGAAHGEHAWPLEWKMRIERSDEIYFESFNILYALLQSTDE